MSRLAVFLVCFLLCSSVLLVLAVPPHKVNPGKSKDDDSGDDGRVNPGKALGHDKDRSILNLVFSGSGGFVNSSSGGGFSSGIWGDWSSWWSVFNVLPDEPMIGD